MSRKVTADAKIVKGALVMEDRPSFLRDLTTLKDGEVEVVVRRLSQQHSDRQRRFYWKVIVRALADYNGDSEEWFHEFLKLKFNPIKVSIKGPLGEIIEERILGGTTKTLEMDEFADYCERIMMWASADLGFYIDTAHANLVLHPLVLDVEAKKEDA